MTTPLETRVLPKVAATVKKYGTLATFTLYLSATSDADSSSVNLGAATVYQRYITPPEDLEAVFVGDGSMVQREGVKFELPSGALTSDPIPFTPTLGLRCQVRGRDYRATKVKTIPSGDHVALYEIEARA